MGKAIYPGSFDPITLGHVDIIRRIGHIFDEVVVLVASSERKQYLFTPSERQQLIREALPNEANVQVDIFDGLTVDYLRQHGARVIVRGLRAVVDYEYELVMANMNRKLSPDVETMIVFASPEYYYISSNAVKEIARYGGDIAGLVPANVVPALYERIKRGRSKET